MQLTRNVSWYEAILSAAPLAGQYLWKMFWPVHLVAFYPFHKSVTPFDLSVLADSRRWDLRAAFSALWKRHHRASFGFIWFFLNIAPVLNSRWLGPNVFTERYLYLPSVGFCWVAAWWIENVEQAALPGASRPCRSHGQDGHGTRLGTWHYSPSSVALAVLAFVRIFTRNRDWLDDETYYRVTLAAVPEAASLRMNLGAVYWNSLRPDAAEREWKYELATAPPQRPAAR